MNLDDFKHSDYEHMI